VAKLVWSSSLAKSVLITNKQSAF